MSRKARVTPSSGSEDASAETHRTSSQTAARWRALFGSEPPHAAGVIAQAVAWREQVIAGGDVAPAIARDLAIASRQAREGRAGVSASMDALTSAASRSETNDGTPSPRPAAPCSISEPASGGSAAPRSETADVLRPARPAAPRTRSRTAPAPLPPASSQLLPGTRLVKAHGGRNHVVEVTDTGFRYEGATFASLSAIARHITGTHWNGLLFFGLRRRKTYPPKAAAHG